ncbi:MAG: carboxypeptidase-like regulatory domain-containing protein, partial [Gemmatimonadaceae bacterium]
MVRVRCFVPALAGLLLAAAPLSAQTGTITGRVVDSTTSAPLSNAIVSVEGTARRALSREDGTFTVTAVPAGNQSVRVRRIGYAETTQQVSVSSGGAANVEFRLTPQAAALNEIVVTGYGTQRREAISGSVSTI